ncbi:MAG TPA: NADH-quinone oxidoreductase subunit M [Nitrososphaeraceae archaeon]|nr:NADH-quinone oxidoreductase subunit M [Nitrososphaeraceae archaeon]
MASESGILLASIFLPLLLAPLTYFLGKKRGANFVTWFSFGTLVLSTILLIIPSLTISEENPVYEESYAWSQFGDFGLKLDGYSISFAVTIYVLSAVIALFSREYMVRKIAGHFDNLEMSSPPSINNSNNKNNNFDEEKLNKNRISPGGRGQLESLFHIEPSYKQHIDTQMGLYFALFLTFTMGMVGTVLSTNLIEFYVFFELMLVPAFFLIALYGYSTRKRVSLMFFFWTHVGAVLLLLGMLAMGLFAGGFDFDTIKSNVSTIPSQWMTLIVFAVVIGISVKLGAFLLHIWIPHTYAESPTPVSALIAGPMSAIGVYALLRIWIDLLAISYSDYSIYINFWGVITMIYGGAMALMQDDIKKLLAYSSISHMGYIIFGLGSQSMLGITGSALMWIPHALGETILFLMAGSLILRTGTRSMSNLGGIARKMPYTATFAMIAVLTMIGVPPTTGFMAEWILFTGALQTGTENMDSFRVVLFSLAILTTILTSSYLLVMYKKIFFGKISPRFEKLRDVNRYAILPMGFMASLTLFLGVYPDPIINPIIAYSEAIFSDSPEIASLPTITNLNNTLVSSGIFLQDEYESFLDGYDRDLHQLKQVKSIKNMENK